VCAVAETPVLTVGSTTLNLTYWERHQMEKGWDGVAIEYSRNGGAWTDMPAPSNSAAGCMVTDVTLDYQALGCTDNPPINACGYPASKSVISGPPSTPDPQCVTPTGDLTAYGRRCHLLTGLTPGDTIQFRWRFTSDPGAEFKGFYLDDIAVTNIRLRNVCTTVLPAPVLTGAASRKLHGGTLQADIPLPLTGQRGVECRSPGQTGTAGFDYKVVFTFQNDITPGGCGTTSTPGGSVAAGPTTKQCTVNLNGLTNAQYTTVTLSSVTDVAGHSGPASAVIGLLVGDVNGDAPGATGLVDSGDVFLVRQQAGQTTTLTNFRKDINANGLIDSGDVFLTRQKTGTQLPSQP
jgi:hypothetical protein